MVARKKVGSKKKNGKAKSLTVRKSTDVASVEAALAKEVDTIADRIGAPSGNKINLSDSTFALPNGRVVDGPFELVIIDFVSSNAYYDGLKYNPKDPKPPVCYAFGQGKHETLSPVPESPKRQSDDCANCLQFEWPAGGKRECKNNQKLVVIDPNADEPEVMIIEVSPTALTRFDALVSTVKDVYAAPPIKVIVAFNFVPKLTYPTLTFEIVGPNKAFAEHYQLRQEAHRLLETLPPFELVAAPARRSAKSKTTTRRARR